jgi:hypothetical protein
MNNAKRRSNGSNFSGLPTVDDARLVTLALTLPLDAAFRAELLEIQPTLVPGKFGTLKKSTRDRGMRLLVESQTLKRVTPEAKPGIHVSISPTGTYEDRRVRGTDFAERLLYLPDGSPKPIPAPLRRIVVRAAKVSA